MGSIDMIQKPHAVCIPYPAQGHINPMLNLAKLLHHRGFHVTFVNTEYNHSRLLRSRGPSSLDGLPSFRFRTIPDGLPPSDVADATQDIPALCQSTSKFCLPYFRDLLERLNEESTTSGSPPVSCVVSDGVMSFTLDAAEAIGVPEVLFWTTSACGFMGYVQYRNLVDKGLTPLKDASYLTNGYLDTIIDWIPGMRNIRLRDLPSFIQTTNPDDLMIHFVLRETERAKRASAIVFNTFDRLEHEVLDALKATFPSICTLGPLHLLTEQLPDDDTKSIGSNLWKEDLGCLEWLDSKPPGSVVYVNFGSITVMSPTQLVEFAWGLANSGQMFLWVIRPDLVVGDTAILPSEFSATTRERSLLASWCPQERVLNHPAVGGFLTHSGWNSTIESITAGVPMLCWPFFAEQQTNCRYSCEEWGIGMEIDGDVKRDKVEKQVRELMEGETGKEMKRKAMEWQEMAREATRPSGSSCLNLDEVMDKVLLSPRRD
ncbi:7-deoxyloganetin glucosyltransferase-like [Eucalyptus grandis]|uniref:7-deoxyloganetin glucosyltransferase-like n=1 Tax=Eucalyptus grandis TaxID=71139 RepID=UPI00192E817D|nr:7-deoxyloganetin glucosyltransferase-like [Eucalyptus grandis]